MWSASQILRLISEVESDLEKEKKIAINDDGEEKEEEVDLTDPSHELDYQFSIIPDSGMPSQITMM